VREIVELLGSHQEKFDGSRLIADRFAARAFHRRLKYAMEFGTDDVWRHLKTERLIVLYGKSLMQEALRCGGCVRIYTVRADGLFHNRCFFRTSGKRR
jgi:hypothetical protein